MDRLSSGEKLAGVTALGLLVASVVELWVKVEAFGVTGRGSAWSEGSSGIVKLALVLTLVVAVLVGLRMGGVKMELPVSWGLIYVAAAGGATVLFLLGLLFGPPEIPGLEVSRGIFLILSPFAAAVMAYGGYQHMQEEGAGAAHGGGTTPAA